MPGSFARRTCEVRWPKILDDTIAANPGFAAELRALRDELTGGALRGLVEEAPDRAAWDAACAAHVGQAWLTLPWYFAESFLYRRVVEATRWFAPESAALDPFGGVKQAEERAMLPRVQAARASMAELTGRARLEALVRAALWGNRADLSYAVGRKFGDAGHDDDVLVDDTARALPLLEGAGRVGIVLDNAGTELAFDLLLAAELARGAQGAREVVLFAKSHPFFVSDAMPVDVARTARLLDVDLAGIEVRAHPYWTSSGFFFTSEMPRALVAELAACDVVIAKGDANYRRLVGDAPWPHETSVDVAMEFPAPVLALRTCKAEVAVGVPVDVAARARARDPDWLVNGRFGMLQLSSAKGP